MKATLGGGCFWCLEAVFERLDGVRDVISGYAGGRTPNPNYKDVCSGSTGHAEVVQIEFHPEQISFEVLLGIFWKIHDPTTPNRQGPDVGSQYRSIILYHDDEQKRIAEESLSNAEKSFSGKIVTELKPLEEFFPAEEEHQDFYRRNPDHPYCTLNIPPKLAKIE